MPDILERLLARPSLHHARMIGASVRSMYPRDPKGTLATVASWSTHPNATVRIAAGVAYGVIGQRDRDSLQAILPAVEALARDEDPRVRAEGAQAALEQLWIAHADAITNLVQTWATEKNDLVKEMVVNTIASVATGGQIGRPSLLRRFIERGLKVFDVMAVSATAPLRRSMAFAIDEIGSLAPDLVVPAVERWATSTEPRVVRLVATVLALPVGGLCEGVDRAGVETRLRAIDADVVKNNAELTRRGLGEVKSLSMMAQEFLLPQPSDHLPWTHVADPYRGCELRCEFCNARTASEFDGEDERDFARTVTVVQNAASLLALELDRDDMTDRANRVLGLGVTSDPYQPAESRFEVTRDVLKTCLAKEHPVVVQTRQDLILRDADVLAALAERGLVNVMISLQCPVEGIRGKIELGTSNVAARMRTMRMLASHGVPVGLLLSPIMPGLTDDPRMIEETIRRAADAGAQWVVPEVLNLHGSARIRVKMFLDSTVPTLVARYRELYTAGERTGDPDPEYARRITEELVPRLAAKHGAANHERMLTSGRDVATCLVRR